MITDFNATQVEPCANCVDGRVSIPAVPLVYSHHNQSNASYDVYLKGCFGDFDTIACVRNGLISSLAVVTVLFCLIKIIRLHFCRHPIWLQYFVFYFAVIECILCAVHWMLGQYVQLYFAAEYCKLLQLLAVTHLHWLAASRILKREYAMSRLHMAVAVVACAACSVLLVIASNDTVDTQTQCTKPYGLALATVELLVVQSLLVAGVIINRRLNEISTVQELRKARKRDLWILIVVFELSAATSVAYDVCVIILGNTDDGCSGIFRHLQAIYSPVFGSLAIFKFILPVWALLYAIQPVEGSRTSDTHHDQVLINEPFEEGDWSMADEEAEPTFIRRPPINGAYRPHPYLAPIREESEDGVSTISDDTVIADGRQYLLY